MTWKDSNDDAAVPAPLGPSLSATCYSSTAHASPRDSHSLPPSCPMSASRCCPSRPSMSCVTSKPYALKSLPSSIACHASAHCRGSACGCGRQYGHATTSRLRSLSVREMSPECAWVHASARSVQAITQTREMGAMRGIVSLPCGELFGDWRRWAHWKEALCGHRVCLSASSSTHWRSAVRWEFLCRPIGSLPCAPSDKPNQWINEFSEPVQPAYIQSFKNESWKVTQTFRHSANAQMCQICGVSLSCRVNKPLCGSRSNFLVLCERRWRLGEQTCGQQPHVRQFIGARTSRGCFASEKESGEEREGKGRERRRRRGGEAAASFFASTVGSARSHEATSSLASLSSEKFSAGGAKSSMHPSSVVGFESRVCACVRFTE